MTFIATISRVGTISTPSHDKLISWHGSKITESMSGVVTTVQIPRCRKDAMVFEEEG